MEKALNASIQYLKGIGPKRAKVFSGAGINTIEDLLYYFPRRYEDRTNFISISKLQEGSTYTIKAEVLAKGERHSYRRRGFGITEVAVGDATGKIFCVWFNRPYLNEYFKVGQTLVLYGKIEKYDARLQMNSPEFEIVSAGPDKSLNIGRIVPIYSLPQRLTQRSLRQLIKYALDEYLPKINDTLPYDIRSRNNLLNLAKALLNIHFPESPEMQKEAYNRLSFEEFFLFQLPLALRKLKKKEKPGIAHQVDGEPARIFMENLPFSLTSSQQRVVAEIKYDMARPTAMQRLLQGDVGSGKTVVATIASLMAIQGGYQVAFMVPTEILARQHYEKIRCQVSGVRCQEKEIRIGLLTSSLENKEKVYKEIKEGDIDLVIGTHALIEEAVKFKKLGLIVIDEQHKFGVGQRALLPAKGPNADILIMTATPIPRTLAITLYGDLDISVINEMPSGRGSIKTLLFTQEEQAQAYHIAREQIKQGNQAYIVYPVIEESYSLDIAGAKKMYEEFKKSEFKDFRLGLIHGRLKQAEQNAVMSKFKNKELDILVSTTVLEVGIDIPAATCMIVQHAQRFGLSQLHQLRGRIGRGPRESFCILISNTDTPQAKARLDAMVKYNDGFRIAEEDLKIRGPGEFFGRRQHGLSELKIANPLSQMQLLKKAREEAIRLVSLDPKLGLRPNIPLREKLLQRFPEYEKLMVVG
ncbi:MAG: ATP-dependent DNA helicase RecG [Candidatus Omnitrophica bacterium]|nr:ATP-dependent DNA helicase RecG [Candidatus Omnitrophota bacterium]MDD5592821.1 ATP-dependent DNA helicase RecG [Candidatus Omnitrophota bacterium]